MLNKVVVRNNCIILFLLSLLLSCSDDRGVREGGEEYKVVKGDTEILKKLINLPENATELKWQAVEDGRGGLVSLSVFLRLSEDDYRKVLDQSVSFENPVNKSRVSKSVYEEWFPETLKSKLNSNVQGGEILLLEVETMPADYFVIGGMSPFVNGHITMVGWGYILIDMHAN